MMTLPGADTMNAGIIGLDCLRFIFLRGFSFRLLVPFVMPLTGSAAMLLVSLLSVMSDVGLSGSESLWWKPLWPFLAPLDARCVVMASAVCWDKGIESSPSGTMLSGGLGPMAPYTAVAQRDLEVADGHSRRGAALG